MSESSTVEPRPIGESPESITRRAKRERDKPERIIPSVTVMYGHLQTVKTKLALLKENDTFEKKRAILDEIGPYVLALTSYLEEIQDEAESMVCLKQRIRERAGSDISQTIREISSVLLGVERVESSLMAEQVAYVKEVKAAFLKALQKAVHSDAPVETIMPAYKAIEQFLAVDVRFRHFLRDADHLMKTFKDNPDVVHRLVLPLLQRVLVEDVATKGLLPLDGDAFACCLLFVADHGLLENIPDSFDIEYTRISSVVEQKLRALAAEMKQYIESVVVCGIYEQSVCRQVLVPQAVAYALIRPDGTLNLGIIDIIKKTHFSPRELRDHVERYIVSRLSELQSNELVKLLEAMSAPTGTIGRDMVNAMLFRKFDREVSEVDTRVALLAALLTWWRQGILGNCYIVSAAVQRQEAVSEWLVEDFRDLLNSEGTLTRSVKGRSVKVYGLEWPQLLASKNSFPMHEAEAVFSLQPVYSACAQLGCETREGFINVVAVVCEKNPTGPLTLFSVFKELVAVNGKSPRDLQRACWIVESLSQNLLLREWENAMGGLYFLPITKTTIPTHLQYPRAYFYSMAVAFAAAAGSLGLYRFTGFLDLLIAPIRQTTTNTPLMGFSHVIPQSLQRFRACLVPHAISDPHDLSWALFKEGDETVVPFNDAMALADFLHTIFVEWVELIEKNLSSETRKKLADFPRKNLIVAFEEELYKFYGSQGKSESMFGTLCYAIGGITEPFGTLEGSEYIPQQFVDMNLGKRPDKAISAFLQWTNCMRKMYGEHPDLKVLAGIADHTFCLLPNHPSIVKALTTPGDPVKDREKFSVILNTKTNTVSAYVHTISDIIDFYASVIATHCDTPSGEIYGMIITVIDRRFGSSTAQCSVTKFLAAAWNVCIEVSKKMSPQGPLSEKLKTRFFLSSLLAILGPSYKDQLIHFADTNWRSVVNGKNQADQYCFWFDPIVQEWEVVLVSESGDPVSDTARENPSFLQELQIQPSISSLTSKISHKELLHIRRKISNRLQKTERDFVASWHELKRLSSELELQQRGIIEEQLSCGMNVEIPPGAVIREFFPLKGIPEPWNRAFDQCMNFRQQFGSIIKEQIQKFAAYGAEYRYTNLFTESGVWPLLMANEEDFRRGVIDSLAVKM
jgi:hypothetical protein